MNADFIKNVLEQRHPRDQWLFATEVRTTSGYGGGGQGGNNGVRYIDAFAMHLWPSKNFHRIAYEIKITKADFLHELEQPTKRCQAVYLSDEFFFVLAPGIYDRTDTPRDTVAECGIMEVSEEGSIKIVRRALSRYQRDDNGAWPMPIWFMASFARRARDHRWEQ